MNPERIFIHALLIQVNQTQLALLSKQLCTPRLCVSERSTGVTTTKTTEAATAGHSPYSFKFE